MDIIRFYIPDAVYFITCVNHQRKPVFAEPVHVNLFMETLSNVQIYYPHDLQAYVVVPDHFHLLIKPNGCTISKLVQSLRRNFTNNFKKHYRITENLTLSQHRFFDHVIRNDKDWARHMDYIHYNPVKHGLVRKPEDWFHSSYLECVSKGMYEIGWGWGDVDSIRNLDLE